MAIDGELFREIMSHFPSGVCVVTANDPGGKPHGLTVSAFCPVSLSPPLVLVCVDRESNTLPAVRAAGGFTVNFLAAGRDELATLFASKDEGKFDSVAAKPASVAGSGPVLHEDSAAHIACKLHDAVEAGDHLILIGSVEAGEVYGGRAPLLYGRRQFAAWNDILQQ
jgi:flavin reductase (DIM6/NTAB) family NADH-FMN oxidoreductase RutF